MNFKDEYFAWEPRLNEVFKDNNILEVEVQKGEKREIVTYGNECVIKVLPSEYDKVKAMVDEKNARKIVQEIEEKMDYDKLCKNFGENKKEDKPKKNIKNKPNKKMKNKKFKVMAILMAAIAGGTLLLEATNAQERISKKAEEYKSEVATQSLSILKEALDANKVYDYSTELSSTTEKIKVVIEAENGETYSYVRRSDSSEPTIDEIKNEEVVSAIRKVAQAQGNANIFETMVADNLTKEIESGKINLEYDGNKQIDQEIANDVDEGR